MCMVGVGICVHMRMYVPIYARMLSLSMLCGCVLTFSFLCVVKMCTHVCIS